MPLNVAHGLHPARLDGQRERGRPESDAPTINTFIMQLGAHWRTLLPPASAG